MQSKIYQHWSRWHNPQGDEAIFEAWNPKMIK